MPNAPRPIRHLTVTASLGAALAFGAGSASACSSYSFHGEPCPFGNDVLAQAVFRFNSILPLMILTNVLTNRSFGGGGLGLKPKAMLDFSETGLPASNGSQWNVWAGAARTNTGYDFAPVGASGHVNNAMIGLDYAASASVTIGAALTIDSSRVGTTFNNTSTAVEGYSIAPYIAWAISPSLLLDASVGLGNADIDTNDPVLALRAKARSERVFGAVSLTYGARVGNTQIALKASYLEAQDTTLPFVTPAGAALTGRQFTRLSQMRFGSQFGWSMGGFMPYAGIAYAYDLQRVDTPAQLGVRPANDRDGFTLSLGANFAGSGGLTGGVQFSSEQGRKEIRNNQLMGNIGLRF